MRSVMERRDSTMETKGKPSKSLEIVRCQAYALCVSTDDLINEAVHAEITRRISEVEPPLPVPPGDIPGFPGGTTPFDIAVAALGVSHSAAHAAIVGEYRGHTADEWRDYAERALAYSASVREVMEERASALQKMSHEPSQEFLDKLESIRATEG